MEGVGLLVCQGEGEGEEEADHLLSRGEEEEAVLHRVEVGEGDHHHQQQLLAF